MFTAADDTGCRRLQLDPRFKNKTQNATMWNGKEEEHNLKATRTSKTERVWTRNKKTGLYAYRNRKLSVLKCNGPMGTLPRTMDSIDGVRGTQLAGWEKASDLEGT